MDSAHLISTELWEPELPDRNVKFVSKPIMGWSSLLALDYEPYDPTTPTTRCLGEEAIISTANDLIEKGYKKLGYEYIIIDDCWQNSQREQDNTLAPNPVRFGHGMRWLADYLHRKGLKLGLFSDLGPKSGAELPGSADHLREDATSFINWGIDYVKMSAFTADPNRLDTDYPAFSDCLKNYTEKDIVYACSWPYYNPGGPSRINLRQVSKICHTFRFEDDVGAWDGILKIMDTYERLQNDMLQVTGPGFWCDADLLAVNVRGVTLEQLKAQMAVWCIMPSSLIFSADVRDLTQAQEAVLKNEAIIAVHQDGAARPGRKLKLPLDDSTAQLNRNVDIWKRRIQPVASNGEYSYAIAFVYRVEQDTPISYSITLSQLGLDNPKGYRITDLYSSEGSSESYRNALLLPTSSLNMLIQPSGVAFFRADVVEDSGVTPTSS